MVVIQKRRPPSEICAFIGCFLILVMAVIQILVFTQKNRTFDQIRTFSRRGLMSGHMNAYPGLHMQQPHAKHASSSVLSAQAKIRARNKANQEVKELERALAKLMRENSMTPEESKIMIQNERYARRIRGIISDAEQDTITPFSVNRLQIEEHSLELNNFSNVFRNFSQFRGSNKDLFSENLSVPYGVNIEPPVSEFSGNTFFNKKEHVLSRQTGRHKNVREMTDVPELEMFRDKNHSFQYLELYPAANLSDIMLEEDAMKRQGNGNHDLCPSIPEGLVGNTTEVNPNITVSVSDILKNNSDVTEGGEWKPSSCVSRHRVAVVIPYRDRWPHLKALLYYLIPTLKRQEIHFRIFVVEQYGNETFNKGRIMNAAFREALKLFDFHCVTFHDVDLIPEDDRNIYSCMDQPKHMSFSIDKFQYVLPYDGLVGGVLMFKTEHFELVNGYSNMYWGWGAEDDDMTTRILHHGLRIYRPPSSIAKYKMVKHDGRKGSEVAVRMKLLRSAARRSKLEGLNNVQYKVMDTHLERLFTHFVVDIGHP